MIVEALVTLAVSFVEWFVSIVPTFGLDFTGIDMAGLWESIGSQVSALNGWLPVVAMGIALAAYLTVQVVMSVWGLIVWIYHQFWGSE